VVSFTTFLSVVVDWPVVWNCHDQSSCNIAAANFIRKDPFENISVMRTIVIIFELVIIAYWVFLLLQYVYEIWNMWTIKHFYNNLLKISEKQLQTLNWDEVVEKIENLQQTKRIAVNGHVTAYEIMNRIMRKENYLIALINKEILNLRVPLPFFNHRHILTESLLWNLRYIINQMFDEFNVKKSIAKPQERAKGVAEIRYLFRWLGVLNLAASPFIFFFLVIYSFFKYSVEIKHSIVFALGRRWSTLARWKFREFNELSHFFENRLRNAHKPANKYCDQFPVYILSIVGKTVMFLSSSFAAVIIVLTTLKNPLLLYFPLLNQNLFWWLTALLATWGFAKSVVIDENKVFDPNVRLTETCKFTHYYPRTWRDRGHHSDVRDEFMYLFPFAIISLFQELASILITPMILLISLPNSAERMVQFISEITIEPQESNMGDICGFASFNFAMFGDELYGSVTKSQAEQGVPRSLTEEEDLRRSRDGKMEMSFLNFSSNYPRWKLPSDHGGEKLIDMSKSISSHKGDMTMPTADVISKASAPSSVTATPMPGTTNSIVFDHPSPLTTTPNVPHPFEQREKVETVTTLVIPPPNTQNDVSPTHVMLESRNLFHMLGSYYPSKTNFK
jgi:autophagy-related protein 9